MALSVGFCRERSHFAAPLTAHPVTQASVESVGCQSVVRGEGGMVLPCTTADAVELVPQVLQASVESVESVDRGPTRQAQVDAPPNVC